MNHIRPNEHPLLNLIDIDSSFFHQRMLIIPNKAESGEQGGLIGKKTAAVVQQVSLYSIYLRRSRHMYPA